MSEFITYRVEAFFLDGGWRPMSVKYCLDEPLDDILQKFLAKSLRAQLGPDQCKAFVIYQDARFDKIPHGD